MTVLPISGHPVMWRVPVSPCDVTNRGVGQLALVPGGAVAARTRADAVVLIDSFESDRRLEGGMGPVLSLPLLDVLIGMPLDVPLRSKDLSEREVRVLTSAPAGCVRVDGTTTARTLRVPATVAAVMVRGTGWRAAMRRTAAFSAFSQRIVLLTREPKPAEVFEAQFVGVGIWVETSGGVVSEHLAPEVFVPKYVKAAGWRFAENAYAASVGAGLVPTHPVGVCR